MTKILLGLTVTALIGYASCWEFDISLNALKNEMELGDGDVIGLTVTEDTKMLNRTFGVTLSLAPGVSEWKGIKLHSLGGDEQLLYEISNFQRPYQVFTMHSDLAFFHFVLWKESGIRDVHRPYYRVFQPFQEFEAKKMYHFHWIED